MEGWVEAGEGVGRLGIRVFSCVPWRAKKGFEVGVRLCAPLCLECCNAETKMTGVVNGCYIIDRYIYIYI